MATFGASAASGIRKKVEKPAKTGIPLSKKIAQSAETRETRIRYVQALARRSRN
jgi:hypothetical protein